MTSYVPTALTRTMLAALIAACLSAQAAPTVEEQLEVLTQELERLKTEVEKQKSQQPASPNDGQYVVPHGAGPAGATRVGGYGELHYNNLDSKKEIDFHRFILFLGHNFADHIRFFSELELEHALAAEGKKGEVELEQAYIEFDMTDKHRVQGGLFLLPVGILNAVHEPTTFYGVKRNPVETDIVPTTWWEGGAGVKGELAPGWGYDLTISSGLAVPTSGANAFKIRSGRQKVSKAKANDLAYTGRISWSGLPGLKLATSLHYQHDLTQGALSEQISATLLEAHAIFQRGSFGLRALYAQWDLNGQAPKAVGRDEQGGWYVEPSFKITPKLGLFARYNEWDNEAGDAADSIKKQSNVGLNWWPHENVVIKFDVQSQSGAVSDDGFNVGIGYMF